jgi:Heterokaryon incompatibility protein (HET)
MAMIADEIVTEETFQPPLYHSDDETPLLRSLDRIKQWVSTCDDHHGGCKQEAQTRHGSSNSPRLPTRLLRLELRPEGPTVFMCTTQGRSPNTRYATLSHCWGTSQLVKLLNENYARFSSSINFASLPQTFQDAINLSLALGIEYLWIDSLCIIQDSHDDWLHEASLMCSVYSNSYLNFAATSSRDGTGGLFHKSALVKNCAVKATWTGLLPGLYLCVDESAWQRRVEDAPLNVRGWVLQERLLAPRTVHCAYDQMWWSCRDAPNCCETFPTGALVASWANESREGSVDKSLEADPNSEETTVLKVSTISLYSSQASLAPLLDDSADSIAWNEAWLAIVRAYTSAQLTYGSDKLIAIAGIAEEARRTRGLLEDDYLAGLWRIDLLIDLLWRMASSGKREKEPYRAPSWSWASVDGEVYFHSPDKRLEARENPVARVLESHTTTNHGWSGPVSNGWLKIAGPILDITLSGAATSEAYEPFLENLNIGNEQFISGESFGEVLDNEKLYCDWPKDGRQLHYACLKVSCQPVNSSGEYESEGLILEHATDRDNGYYRIGWLRVDIKTPLAMDCRQHHKSYIVW